MLVVKRELIVASVLMSASTLAAVAGERRISVEEYRDKMAAGWIGQMVGVGWGAPTEFKFNAHADDIDCQI